MPNGKEGDHWYTDVASHRIPTFSLAIDSLIREVHGRVHSPHYAPDPPVQPYEHPLRLRLEEIVEAHLARAGGYEELSTRGEGGWDWWSNLTSAELDALEADLRAWHASIPPP